MENINKRVLALQRGVGNPDIARKEIYERFNTGIFKSVFSILKQQEDTEDVVSDTFIKIFTCIEQYNPKWEFSTWAYRIARNEAIDHLRRKKKNTISLSTPVRGSDSEDYSNTLEHFISQNKTSLEDILSQKQVIDFMEEKVVQNFSHLGNKFYDEIYRMLYKKDMEYEEISKKLNIPFGTVKVRILEIREFLRGEVADFFGKEFLLSPVDIKGRGNPIRKKLIREENKQVFLRIEKEKAAKRLLQKRK